MLDPSFGVKFERAEINKKKRISTRTFQGVPIKPERDGELW